LTDRLPVVRVSAVKASSICWDKLGRAG